MKMTGCLSVSVKYVLCSEANLQQVYRVHWLRAKARKDRWNEEMILLKSETGWVCAFFTSKVDEWNVVKKRGHGEG